MRLDPVKLLVGIVVGSVALTGCGDAQRPARTAATSPPPSILSAPVRPTSFAQARGAVLALYRSHRAVSSFTVKDVEYTAASRDKVLSVCHRAGPEKSARARESVRVLACAPLIFFFYSYGRQASVPEAVGVAQRLYWYAVTNNRAPDQVGPGLARLLRSWGVA